MTTTHTVTVYSFQEVQDKMDLLGKNAEDFIQRSMYMALNGDVDREIKTRMPVANNKRYNHRWSKDGKDLGPKKKGSKGTGAVNQLKTSYGGPKLKGTDEVTIGATAPYAEYVHEATKPVEGHYWEPGKKGGWSRKGSGNKFISRSLEKHADDIPEWASKQLDDLLHKAGII